MKIHKLLILVVFSLMSIAVAAQENNVPGAGGGTSCSCSDSTAKCSSSASCSNGNAVCVCSENGCTSYCINNNGAMGDFPDSKNLSSNLQKTDNKEIGVVLTKALGKTVSFVPYKADFRFDAQSQPADHWDVLQYLAQNGELKINNGDFATWKKIREIVNAGKVNFCTSNITVGALVNELSFFGGRKYQIVSGSPNEKLSADIKGLNIEGIINALEKHHQLLIEQK